MIDLGYLQTSWKSLVGGAFRKAGLDAFLRYACEPVALEGETLTLRFYHSFHKEKIEAPENLRQVEAVLRRELGHSLKVLCILESRKPRESPDQGSQLFEEVLKLGGKPLEES